MSDKKQMRVGEQRGYRPQGVVNKVDGVTQLNAMEQAMIQRRRDKASKSSRPVKG